MIDQTIIDNTYDELYDATLSYGQAVTQLTAAKRAYEARRAELLDAGVDGKNVDQRNAALVLALAPESQAVMQAEDDGRHAKLMLTLADLERSRLRMIIENEANHFAVAIAQAEQTKRLADALESVIVDLSNGEKTINVYDASRPL